MTSVKALRKYVVRIGHQSKESELAEASRIQTDPGFPIEGR
jgi:hypothetical protein